MAQNLFYVGSSTIRVKIVEVLKFGICKVRDRQGETNYVHLGDLKKVCFG